MLYIIKYESMKLQDVSERSERTTKEHKFHVKKIPNGVKRSNSYLKSR